MLIAARLLVPAEAAVLGGSLWITQLWFLAVVFWAWDAYRRGDYRLRFGAIDAAVWVVAAGHLVSACYVLQGNGEGRAALNLMWEWLGLAFAFLLVRQVTRTKEDTSRFLVMLLAFAVVMGGYGIWQHYIEMPRLWRNYERIVEEVGQISGPNGQRDAIRLRRELAKMGVPFDPQSRSRWEARLKSTEPFATFALANTLAGFLAAWLFVLLDWLWLSAIRAKDGLGWSWRNAAKLAGGILIAYCLVLTKSRTAWVGLFVGALAWGALRGRGILNFSRRSLLMVAGLALVVSGFLLIAGLSGGFDKEVILEAPKSLEYRRQYWAGAWDVVQQHPWLGTGPGNFRQHYLHYKRPESSEEIADPHNWVLDLWTSGGLLALCGFAAVLVLAVRAGWRNRKLKEQSPDSARGSVGISAWEVGAGLSFFLVLFMGWLSAEPFDARLLGLFAGWILAWAVLQSKHVFSLPWAGAMAGGLAILVHLLGAGGIEMPAIMQTILLLVVLLDGAGDEGEASPAVTSWPKSVAVLCGLAVAGSVLCWQTATKPIWYRTLLITSGDAALIEDANPKAAAKWYEEARQADPYSPEPLERLAEVHFQNWQRNGSEREFEEAVKISRRAVLLDPVSYRIYRQLGRMHFQKAERSHSPTEAKAAVDYLKEAAARYPSSSFLRAELAMAFEQAGETEAAVREAAKALELDKINRDAGHSDKFLPEDIVERLIGIEKE
jgi:hypothetical protein